jgi:NhaA family Na+:H+ antiporter
LLALTIPLKPAAGFDESGDAPLLRLEHALHSWVVFLIIPIFGFANAGVSCAGLGLSSMLQPVPW